jgi:phage terminase small subunit
LKVAIASVDDPVRYETVCADYARSISRCDVLQREWERIGRPTTTAGGSHGHATVSHPALVAIERAEDHVFKLASSLGLNAGRLPAREAEARPAARNRAAAPNRAGCVSAEAAEAGVMVVAASAREQADDR